MPRTIAFVFEQYRAERLGFAQQCAEFSQWPEQAEKMIQLGVVVRLRDLLTDLSAAVQKIAALTVSRLCSHSPKISELMLNQEIIRIILYFNMDKSNNYVKSAALMAVRAVVRHNAQLARSVIDIGGLDPIVSLLEDFDPEVKEVAAWVCSYVARYDLNTAYSIIGAGALPLLIQCLKLPEVTVVRTVAASALSDVCKHSSETAQTVIDLGAIAHLVQAAVNASPNLKRQVFSALSMIAKHTMAMAEAVLDEDNILVVLEHCGHKDEMVRTAACSLVRDIVKHSPELAHLFTEAGGLGVLVNAVVQNTGLNKLPGIVALGFIGGHSPDLALSVVYSKGIDALALAIEETVDGTVVEAAAWALGHIGRHSGEHAKHITSNGILSKMLLENSGSSIFQIANIKGTLSELRQIEVIAEGISVDKSPSDKREYRAFVFKNQLKVLLISEPTTDRAAASLTVAAGSMCDPNEIPGMAHFCEHMLFLGTEKYPDENDFDKYVCDNGGSTNAETDTDNTRYYFDVDPEALHGALDRFVQFFLNPLFSESGTQREINAVNSEHEQNIPDDSQRIVEVQARTANPKHPFSRFGTGNWNTLWVRPKKKGIDIREALFDYHRKYYSANLMTLAVLGNQSLDKLKRAVEPLFRQIVNKNEPMPSWPESPFTKKELGVWVNVVPIKELRDLDITFPYRHVTNMYQAASLPYVCHLLGHEGAGSLLSLLKNKGWANTLNAKRELQFRGFSTVSVELSLTEDGLNHVTDIVNHVFQYLEMMRRAGPQKWVWEELRDVAAIKFRFKNKMDPQNYVSLISAKMIDYPLNHVLSAGYIISEFNQEEITEIMECLRPANCRIMLSAKELASKANLVEPYYGAQYSVEKMDPALLQTWTDCGVHEELQLPSKNEYIPSNFDLKPRLDWGIEPRIIMNEPLSRVWFLQDNEFLLPKSVVQVEMYSPLPHLSPLHEALNYMLKRTIEDALNESTYAATDAGLTYGLQDTVYGFEVWVGGYDHRLGTLLHQVMEKIVDFECNPERFEILKEVYERSLKNWSGEQPRHHASWYVTYVLSQDCWTHKQILDSLKEVTVERLIGYGREFISKLKFEWLVYGNMTETGAKSLVSKCQALFEEKEGLSPAECTRLSEVKLESGADYVFSQDHHQHSESCTLVLFQAGPDETRENVLIELLNQIAKESCFAQLRTKEQLGYTVWSYVRRSRGSQGFLILVQGGKHPLYVEHRIDCYLESLYGTLQEMPEEEFLQHRSSLVSYKSEKPETLMDRASLLWEEIQSRQLKFSRAHVEIQELQKVTLEDLRNFFSELIGPTADSRRRLTIHVISQTKMGAGSKKERLKIEPAKTIERNPVPILDVKAWKAAHDLFPTIPDTL